MAWFKREYAPDLTDEDGFNPHHFIARGAFSSRRITVKEAAELKKHWLKSKAFVARMREIESKEGFQDER